MKSERFIFGACSYSLALCGYLFLFILFLHFLWRLAYFIHDLKEEECQFLWLRAPSIAWNQRFLFLHFLRETTLKLLSPMVDPCAEAAAHPLRLLLPIPLIRLFDVFLDLIRFDFLFEHLGSFGNLIVAFKALPAEHCIIAPVLSQDTSFIDSFLVIMLYLFKHLWVLPLIEFKELFLVLISRRLQLAPSIVIKWYISFWVPLVFISSHDVLFI